MCKGVVEDAVGSDCFPEVFVDVLGQTAASFRQEYNTFNSSKIYIFFFNIYLFVHN